MFKPMHGAASLFTLGSLGLFFWGGGSSTAPVAPPPPPSGFPGGMSLPPPSKPPTNNDFNKNLAADNSNVTPGDFFKYGFPGPIHDIQRRSEFISVYDRQTRNPYYVVEHITPESLKRESNGGNGGDRKNSVFKEDEEIPDRFRARLRDYFRSGYDRGHQAPAADAKYSQSAMDETFYLTNMSPQVGQGFNRDYWAHLEDFVRRLTKSYRSVRVVTGPLYLPKRDPVDGKFRVSYEVIGNPPSIAVPTHFFKLIVAEQSNKRSGSDDSIAVTAFVLPNEVISNDIPLRSFEIPVEALEKSTGLEFLKLVPESKKRQLCKETDCSIIVRTFDDASKLQNQQLLLPPGKN